MPNAMFLNDLYHITEKQRPEGGLEVIIRVDPGHTLYGGHFPGHPVTPGVVQLEIVKEILETELGQKLTMTRMRQCKFLSVHNPEESPVLTVAIRYRQEEFLEVQASGSSGDNACFKLTASYKTVG